MIATIRNVNLSPYQSILHHQILQNLVSINGFRWKYMLTAVNRGLLVFGVFDNLNFYVIKILMLKRLFL